MYQAQPTFTDDLSQQQMLQLLMLADRFEVPKVMAAVLSAFRSLPEQDLEWETAASWLPTAARCTVPVTSGNAEAAAAAG
jgi:hypothetical protein